MHAASPPITRRTLRAAAASYGRGGPPRGRGRVALADLLADPYVDPADAHRRLALVERRLYEADDRRAVFLTVYGAVTARVRRDLSGDRFDDPAWVGTYLTAFANRYRTALAAYERNERDRVPRAWLLAFDAALAGDTLVTQDALLGINAHVVHDLALALVDAGVEPKPARRADHDAVNAVLAELVDVEQALLARRYAPGLADLDAAGGRVDEQVAFLTLAEGRDWAWHCAVALSDGGPLGRRVVRWLLERVSAGAGRLVLAPSRHDAARDRLADLERA
ncbi:DUF5995 family protein [Halobaculum lipolyticum]|uniref:DUF5995 family protein n=1 Tax=Halobaculum lipolyticum TaxID=3032001 RepID=A0ABD5WJ71_9EURY|nr:DUF5995 family protein [Halobaculum sp. DT31]